MKRDPSRRPPPYLMLTDPQGVAPGAVVGGRWRVRGLLGRGTMATVFEVLDQDGGTDEVFALKLLSAIDVRDAVPRFEREARLACTIVHPNVVRTLAFGIWTGRPFLTMERLHGETLAERLRARTGAFAVGEAMTIASDVAAGLGAVHALGIAHRDLSPGNVFLVQDGPCRVMDFGSARPPEDPMGVSSGRLLLGTPSSLAPERVHGGDPGSSAGDLWSLGVLIHRMLAGADPFTASTPLALLQRIVRAPAEPLRGLRDDLPRGLSLLVLRMLSKDPSMRPTLAEVQAGLLPR